MPWLSLPEYARQTGTPESTVRALIRAGKLEGHQEQRAPGDPRIVWKVWIEDPQEPATEPSSGHPPSPSTPEVPQPQPPATEPPAATTRTLEILAESLETERAERTRLAAELLAATERAARAEAERDAARQTAADLKARLAAAEERINRPWWRWW